MNLSVGPLVSPADAYEIYRACATYDLPDVPVLSRDGFVARYVHPWPGADHEQYVAQLDGAPVGFVNIELPYRDNLDVVNIELAVLP